MTLARFLTSRLGALALAALMAPLGAPATAQTPFELSEIIESYAQSPKRAKEELYALAHEDPERWASELARAGRQPGAPSLFYFDAARLISLHATSADQLDQAALMLGREARFELWDRSEWLFVCQKIGSRGGDARPCARRLLDEKTFHIALSGGQDVLGKDYALVFVLLSMPETLWNREMGDRLWRGADVASSQNALLTALFYAVSLRDDAILVKYSDDPSRPASGRARANALLGQMSAMERAASAANIAQVRSSLRLPEGIGEIPLRQRRRAAMTQVSRSALTDLERYTYLIRAAAAPRWRQDAIEREPPR